MTCRHDKDDENCSSHRNYIPPVPVEPVWKPTYVTVPPLTPDAKNYVVERALQVDKHLILRVKYPNCAACAFEGSKVMVFLNVAVIDALLWREIDPHFRDTAKSSRMPREAPSPAARFPATHNGWQDAIDYARSKA